MTAQTYGSFRPGKQRRSEQQGLLYYRIKDINEMGQEVFTGNRLKSGQYNTEILNRRGGAEREKEEPVLAGAKA
ncbi:MAG: hypothetical protein V1874_07865 [Spirochaetota bacterium]